MQLFIYACEFNMVEMHKNALIVHADLWLSGGSATADVTKPQIKLFSFCWEIMLQMHVLHMHKHATTKVEDFPRD